MRAFACWAILIGFAVMSTPAGRRGQRAKERHTLPGCGLGRDDAAAALLYAAPADSRHIPASRKSSWTW